MTIRRFSFTALALALAFAVTGCSAAADPLDTAHDEETGRTRAAIDVGEAGPLKLVGDAFGDVSLDRTQRTELERLADEAIDRHAAVREARSKVATALASQVERGAIDRAALSPLFEAVGKEMRATRPEDAMALERVHAMLDVEQRSALVEAIQERISERFGGRREKLDEIAERLQLSDEQRSAVRSIIMRKLMSAGPGRMKERFQKGKEALEAFKGPDFDLDQLLPQDEDRAARGPQMFLDVAEEVLPELDGAQRKRAAELIREKASELEP